MNIDRKTLFADMYIQYCPSVYRYVRNRAIPSSCAVTLTRKVFAELWERLGLCGEESDINGRKMLSEIMKRSVREYFAGVKTNAGEGQLPSENESTTPFADVGFDRGGALPDGDENEAHFGSEVSKAFRFALLHLTKAEYELLALYTDGGMSYEELAERLGTNADAVGMRINRLKKKLAKLAKKNLE